MEQNQSSCSIGIWNYHLALSKSKSGIFPGPYPSPLCFPNIFNQNFKEMDSPFRISKIFQIVLTLLCMTALLTVPYPFESQLCKLKSISFHILILNFNACIRSGWEVICFIYGTAQQIQQNDSFLPNLHHLESFGKILCSSIFRIAHVRSNRCILEILIIERFLNNFT